MIPLLLRMLNVLQQHKYNKEELIMQFVNERLDKSFNQYNKELQQSIEFLTKKHEKSLVKRIKNLDDQPN